MKTPSFPLVLQLKALYILTSLSIALFISLSQPALAQAPTITSFTPDNGPIGTNVVITGTNFSATPANNTVYFGGVSATVTLASTTSLTVTVPTGATWQPISVTTNNLTAYSAKPFTATFTNPGTNFAASSFASPVDFIPSGTYHRVATGDFDGDGKIDMAVTNEGSANVSVFKNTSTSGSVSMSNYTDYTTGTNPTDIVLADIDGDGKLDMAISNSLSNSVSVFRNTSSGGTISFAAKVDISSGSNPYGIAIGDLNGDGKPDIAMLNQTSSTLSIFRNTSTLGTISFAGRQDFTTGTNPLYVTIADFDGDGKVDVATANGSSNTFSTFRNTTSTATVIAFAPRTDVTTGSAPFGISSGDLDGDGKPDIGVVNYSGNTVQLFRNTSSSGSISWATAVSYATNTSYAITIGELNGDGKPDLLVGNYGGSTVSLFRNISTSGTIAFDTKVDYTTWNTPTKAAFADIDGDGKPDVVVAHQNNQHISVLRNLIAGAPLSVRLLGFNAVGDRDKISLQWSTASEHNNRGFGIERSEDARTFTQIGWVDTKGDGSSGHEYAFNDKQVSLGHTYYYRLQMADLDGSVTLSATLPAHLQTTDGSQFLLYPNPASNHIEIALIGSTSPGALHYTITNVLGAIAQCGSLLIASQGTASPDISDLPSRRYFITITSGQQPIFTAGFTKN